MGVYIERGRESARRIYEVWVGRRVGIRHGSVGTLKIRKWGFFIYFFFFKVKKLEDKCLGL